MLKKGWCSLSSNLVALNPALQRFVAEQYSITVRDQHLLVHDVPYVASDKTIKRGTLSSVFTTNAGVANPPETHQVWFTGEFPCFANGAPMDALGIDHAEVERFPGFKVNHYFSNKADGFTGYPDHYLQLTHYVNLIVDQVQPLQPGANAQTGQAPIVYDTDSVFRYPDSASARGRYLVTSERLAVSKMAIIGLGGTGGYVLDQTAKTPAKEIHLYDGDEFLEHNAFRAPGAARADELAKRMPKVEYFYQRYDAMHKGIIPHPYYVTEATLGELVGFDFVFLCVDKGPVRALIGEFLMAHKIPFIDCGMDIQLAPDSQQLFGACRVTLLSPDKSEHWKTCVPVHEDDADAIYDKNIQVADMNAMNALLAVMKWKQYFGFYTDDFRSHQIQFSVSSPSLVRSENLGRTK
jgi:hypothetical protein